MTVTPTVVSSTPDRYEAVVEVVKGTYARIVVSFLGEFFGFHAVLDDDVEFPAEDAYLANSDLTRHGLGDVDDDERAAFLATRGQMVAVAVTHKALREGVAPHRHVAACASGVSADCTGLGTAYAGRCLPCDLDLAAADEWLEAAYEDRY